MNRTLFFAAALFFAGGMTVGHHSSLLKGLFAPVHAASGCSQISLQGGYAVYGPGNIIQLPPGVPLPTGPLAEVALYNFDGAGRFSGNGTLSLNGTILQPAINGTYAVNSDCTLALTINTVIEGAPGPSLHATGVIAADGKEIPIIGTDPGTVQYRILRKQNDPRY